MICRETGEALAPISERLGLIESTLARWLRQREKKNEVLRGFRSVAIVPSGEIQRSTYGPQLRSKVTEIRDQKTLQEVACHLEKTVIRQHKEIAKLRLDNARLRGQNVSPETELMRGGRYSIDFAAHVAERKYLDHLPLERQVRAMERAGLVIDSQTLWDQIEKLAQHLQPTYEALLKAALKAGVIYADETRWQMMTKNKSCRWWTWCVVSDEIATYRIFSNRSQDAAARMLGEFGRVAMTDGYATYDALVKNGKANVNLTIAHCWAHVRRKFIEAEDAYPELSQPAVEMIKDLYRIEKKIPRITTDTTESERKNLTELRHKIRQQESRPKIDEIRKWAFENLPNTLAQSKMGRALNYMLKLWPGLTVFLDNPGVPLDNNAAERALRGVVVGRKNHYGSRSKRGTEVAALFYTMMETAKLSGVDAAAYLREAATRAIKKPGTVTLPSDLT